MTILVTVQDADDLTRVRRYDGRAAGHLVCTHEGFYEPATVSAADVVNYHYAGSPQDKRGWRSPKEASWDHYGVQPA